MKQPLCIFKKIRLAIGSLGLMSVALLSLNSCHKESTEFVGPGYCPSANFQEAVPFDISSPGATINLNTTPMVMTANFNEAISWTITITQGQAKKVYSKKSSSINISWYGEPGDLNYFQDGFVEIDFKIACQDSRHFQRTITANKFGSYPPDKGILTSSFDGNGAVSNNAGTLAGSYVAGGWSTFVSSSGGSFTEFNIGSGPLSNPSGDPYLTLKGQAGAGLWYIGDVYADISLSTLSSSDQNEIYFNCLVNPGSNQHTLFTITLKCNNVNYKKNVYLNKMPSGWNMLSFKLSDFQDQDGLTMPNASVTMLTFSIGGATATGQNAEVNIDNVIFTVGAPFFLQ